MNAKNTKKSRWSQIVTIFVIVMLVLAALPVQSAHADVAGFSAPSIYISSTLLNAGNAYLSDNMYVQSNGNNKSAVYGNFGLSIPVGSTINLVEVRVEGHGNKNWKVSVSNNNGASYSAFATITNTAVDSLTVTAGPGTLWGLTGWTAASLNNANFKVKITSAGGNSSNIAYLDQLMVRVTYTSAAATATTLVISPPTAGTYGGTVDLQAILTSGGLPLSNKTIVFSLDGFSRGPATTNASGVATLPGVTLTTGLSGTLLNVGNYNVDATFSGDSTYAFSSDTDVQIINPRAITVTADAKSKVYGASDPALTFSFAPALIGTDTFNGALARTAGENIGTHAITQGTLALSPNYAITYVGANLTITPLGITVTADNKAVHALDPDPIFTFSVSHFVSPDAFITAPTCSVSGDHSALGTYPIVCSGGDAGPNYSIAYNNGTLTVTDKFVLTVTADPQTITYGDPEPNFTFAYSGFVDGDTDITGTAPTCDVPGAHTNAGSYPSITCSGGVDSKYAFSYTSNTLTVNPLAVTVTADSQNKTYGSVDPTLTYSVTPALISGDSFSGVLTRAAGENTGVYAITQGTLALGSNYTITYVGANLTIHKAPLTVTADDQTVEFGSADPLFTFQYDGFVNSEDSSVIDTPPTCGVSGSHTAVGTYPVVCSGGLDNNYSFTYVNGTLSVIPASAAVDVWIAGNLKGSYTIPVGGRETPIFNGINNGPVQVLSTNAVPIITSERAYRGPNYSDWNEMMGFPANQLTTEYWFPLCDGTNGAQTFISIGNASQSTAQVTVKIAGQVFGSYTIPVGGRVTPSCVGINNGPVQVYSTNGTNIIVSERAYRGPNYTDWNEMMGFPANELTSEYWFPLCDGTGGAQTFISIGNASQSTAQVTVKIAGQVFGSYNIPVGGRVTPNCAGINNGPVQVYSTNGTNIIVSERAYRGPNYTDWNEMMGLPANQLTAEYWFPLCDGTNGAQTFISIGNASQSTAQVTVKIAGQLLGNYTIPVGGRVTPSCDGINNGPVQVYSTNGTNLITSERAYRGANFTDWNEMMGFPANQLTSEYWFPLYDTTGIAQTFITIGNAQ